MTTFNGQKKNISKYCDVAPLIDLNEMTRSVISTENYLSVVRTAHTFS